jgi:hypothetical protein
MADPLPEVNNSVGDVERKGATLTNQEAETPQRILAKLGARFSARAAAIRGLFPSKGDVTDKQELNKNVHDLEEAEIVAKWDLDQATSITVTHSKDAAKDVSEETKTADDIEFNAFGKVERQSIAENIIDLMTEDGVSAEGLAQLEERLKDSQGNALVVVHPLYHEGNVYSEIRKMYYEYLKGLVDEITTSKKQGLPIILLELDDNCNEDKLPKILNRMEMDDQEVFLVPTQSMYPEPQNGVPLTDFASLLRSKGLNNIKVIGTQFWKNPENHFKKFGGCAGETIEKFDKAGVKAIPGEAVLGRI